MTGTLQRVPLRPGMYRPNATMVPTADGNFTAGNLTPRVDGNFTATIVEAAVPQLTYLPPEGNGGYGPRVEVFIEGLSPSGGVTVWRESGDQRLQVRGGVQKMGTESVLVVDSEVPFGRPVTYRIELLNGEGESAGYTPGADITLDAAVMGTDYGKSFVHNVLEPSKALDYVFSGDALGALAPDPSGELWRSLGSSDARWIGGVSGGLVGVNVSGSTYTLEDHRTLAGMFGTKLIPKIPILVFRTPPELLLPGTFYARTVPVAQPVNVAWGGGEWVRWQMSADEVAPPFPGLSEAGVSLADLAVMFTTLAEAAEAYPTLLDVARDYSLAGLADN